jgi:sugar lactone lactonase YvrE
MRQWIMSRHLLPTGVLAVAWVVVGSLLFGPHSLPAAEPAREARLLAVLPDYCNTPDGMTLLPDGNLILSVPNFTDMTSPGVLMKVSPKNEVSLFYRLPAHPDSGKVFPMGVCAAPGGDLFVADCQVLVDANHKSRLLRVVVKNGRPVETRVVASGLVCANGVTIRDGYVYLTDSVIDGSVEPILSGVYRFRLDEENVAIQPGKDDPHVLAITKTKNPVLKVGADGIAFDSHGNLYIGNCGDATVDRIELDAHGKVKSYSVFAKADFLKSVDGLYCDQRTDTIYVADILANAIQTVSPDGSVRTLAQNADTDGSDGRMDAPCEAIVRGDEVIVSNFDRVFPGTVNTKPDKPYTLSVISLKP